jgi:glycosyltransferase involved in cell wall biosynthesis
MATPNDQRRKRLAILINTVAPYRLPVYAELAQQFDTVVLHGGGEANRSWNVEIPPHLRVVKVFTFQIPVLKQTGVPGITDTTYVHLNAGLLWWLPKFRPDIIISNELGFRTILAMVYAQISSVPLWVWWGGTLHSEQFVSGRKQALRRFVARRIKHWISYGKTSTEYLEKIGVLKENILQIQNCVPNQRFVNPPLAENSSIGFEADRSPILLSVGQLIARKGLDKLVEACGRLSARGANFTLVIVGNGPERESLQKLAESVGLRNFYLLENQPQQVLAQLYRRADVFVFPTMEDVWGLVVNEALWSGCTVLCSKYAGCAGEIVPTRNVFDPLSDESFDEGLQRALRGDLASADQSLLLTCEQVSSMIAESLRDGRPKGRSPIDAASEAHHRYLT